MKTFLRNFITCGILGWCIEILFTAMHSLQKRDMRLSGQTSLWMFPIYGMAAFLQPFSRLLRGFGPVFRGSVYAVCIFITEFISGRLLWKRNCCPWDYGRTRWHIGSVIRLDFLPCWFAAGLFFERILGRGNPQDNQT